MDQLSNQQLNKNSNNTDQSLISIVNLISNNLNNPNKQNNSIITNNNEMQSLSQKDSNDPKKNKKDDDLLLEIDQIIGNDNINNILESTSANNTSETSSLNENKSFSKVEIKDNHFINNNGINSYSSYLRPFELSEETLNEPILTTIYRDLYLIYTK